MFTAYRYLLGASMIHQYHFALLQYPNTMETGKKICCLCNNTLLEFYRTKNREAYFALSSAYRYIYSREAVPHTSQIPRAASSESYPLTEDGRGLVKDSILERIEQVIPLSPSSCCLLELCWSQRSCGRMLQVHQGFCT